MLFPGHLLFHLSSFSFSLAPASLFQIPFLFFLVASMSEMKVDLTYFLKTIKNEKN